jgi:hypothetical protein
MSSVLKIVYFSSLTIVLIGLINPVGARFQAGKTSTDRVIVAEFTPDPSRPPVVTQGSGTR